MIAPLTPYQFVGVAVQFSPHCCSQQSSGQANLISASDNLSSIFTWIIDFGASHYMIRQRKSLMIASYISPRKIGLQNGAHTIAIFEGNVKLGSILFLTGVFYITNLTCNLLSLSQLLYYHPTYEVHFSKDLLRRQRLEQVESFMWCTVLPKKR